MRSRCYVVLDTESSMCLLRRRRLLLALAYEVLMVEDAHDHSVVECYTPVIKFSWPWFCAYDIVCLPRDVMLDEKSRQIHGISAEDTWSRGTPLRDVLCMFFDTIEKYRPDNKWSTSPQTTCFSMLWWDTMSWGT